MEGYVVLNAHGNYPSACLYQTERDAVAAFLDRQTKLHGWRPWENWQRQGWAVKRATLTVQEPAELGQ